MSKSSIIKGISAGFTTGAIVYAISRATKHEKKVLKSRTGKAMRAISGVMDELSSMIS